MSNTTTTGTAGRAVPRIAAGPMSGWTPLGVRLYAELLQALEDTAGPDDAAWSGLEAHARVLRDTVEASPDGCLVTTASGARWYLDDVEPYPAAASDEGRCAR